MRAKSLSPITRGISIYIQMQPYSKKTPATHLSMHSTSFLTMIKLTSFADSSQVGMSLSRYMGMLQVGLKTKEPIFNSIPNPNRQSIGLDKQLIIFNFGI